MKKQILLQVKQLNPEHNHRNEFVCWFPEKRHEMSGDENEKEDISRPDGGDDIKVRRGSA